MNEVILDRFCELILQQTGLCIREKDRGSLHQKIEERLQELNLDRADQYYDALSHSSNAPDKQTLVFSDAQRDREWKTFVQLLTTGESYFFRDRQQLDLLERSLLPSLIRRKRKEHDPQRPGKPTLKIWSAGCSSGEETYSIAILVKQLIPNLSDWDVFVLGTDINQSYLERARSGIYREWSFRQVNPDIKRQYFTARGKEYELSPDIRRMVTFRQGNLIRDRFPDVAMNVFEMDVIICRNVFIYFDAPGIASVLNKFHDTLSSTGYLIAGHAELQGQDLSQFTVQSLPGSVVYQKQSADNAGTVSRPSATAAIAFPSFPSAAPQSPAPSRYADELRKQRQSVAIAPKPAAIAVADNSEATSSQPPEAEPSDDLARAISLFQQEDYDEALAVAADIERSRPNCIEAILLTAQVYANRGETAAAKQQCQRALDLDSLSPEGWHLLARIAEEEGQTSEAKKYLKKIIYINPKWVTAYLDLGAMYEEEGDRDRGRKMYAAAIDILKALPPDEAIAHREPTTASTLLAYARRLHDSK
ncbi:MAG: CheR family methyltransferase [Cyanobacteria bacterium J06639_1]